MAEPESRWFHFEIGKSCQIPDLKKNLNASTLTLENEKALVISLINAYKMSLHASPPLNFFQEFFAKISTSNATEIKIYEIKESFI
jgi:hypothetical protein